ncbi:MAG: 50S ribosomal protein L29 [Eubacterium sp.]|uniref:50S ribosomal protein L29 n=1 Tax=Eubacterium sp. TaxID=142586 RepID=UPI003A3849E5
MKAAEIKALSADQRAAKLKELKEELFNLHFQQAINQLDNPMRIKAVRKDIARIKTVEREIELADANS